MVVDMRDLAPAITRQRLLIEGLIGIEVDPEVIERYFAAMTGALELRAYAEPIIYAPGSLGREDNEGYDAFIPLIDSGIALYVWSKARFVSVVVYTCKHFDAGVAVRTTQEFFAMSDVESQAF
jgi:S-adenosylmethionine decarboxylase